MKLNFFGNFFDNFFLFKRKNGSLTKFIFLQKAFKRLKCKSNTPYFLKHEGLNHNIVAVHK
jgi:hypothetical protein